MICIDLDGSSMNKRIFGQSTWAWRSWGNQCVSRSEQATMTPVITIRSGQDSWPNTSHDIWLICWWRCWACGIWSLLKQFSSLILHTCRHQLHATVIISRGHPIIPKLKGSSLVLWMCFVVSICISLGNLPKQHRWDKAVVKLSGVQEIGK